MSLYNLINGVNPALLLFFPMLDIRESQVPRIRDCFLGDAEHPEHADRIIVYTRTGGGNREEYEVENEFLRSLPGFVEDYDDDYDCTYANWVYDVPERWRADLAALRSRQWSAVSADYKAQLRKIWPTVGVQFVDKMDAALPEGWS